MSIDQFLREHNYPCWCGEKASSVFCKHLSGRRPFVVLRCGGCGTHRILPRVLDTPDSADTLYNTYIPPQTSEKDLMNMAVVCLQRLEKVGVRFNKGNKVLDVGCGNGRLLEAICAKFGCVGHGVDADARRINDAIIHSKHATFERGLFDPANFSEPFDTVLSSAVIEHVPDPVDFVRNLTHVLKPGGSLYLLTPNAASLNYSILRSWWRELLSLGEHIYLFTPESLTGCAKRAGLTEASSLSDFDYVTPNIRMGGLREAAVSGWSAYREAVKRASSVFAGTKKGDILCAHYRKD